MKCICQHCESHFDYFVTELTDNRKMFKRGRTDNDKEHYLFIRVFLAYVHVVHFIHIRNQYAYIVYMNITIFIQIYIYIYIHIHMYS